MTTVEHRTIMSRPIDVIVSKVVHVSIMLIKEIVRATLHLKVF